ncbi:hypothetical protein FGB62_2g356 [Gracilaria domingensis]|nr:hypothetical protein FGB62_2g356 [Gracilaria domingensis]
MCGGANGGAEEMGRDERLTAMARENARGAARAASKARAVAADGAALTAEAKRISRRAASACCAERRTKRGARRGTEGEARENEGRARLFARSRCVHSAQINVGESDAPARAACSGRHFLRPIYKPRHAAATRVRTVSPRRARARARSGREARAPPRAARPAGRAPPAVARARASTARGRVPVRGAPPARGHACASCDLCGSVCRERRARLPSAPRDAGVFPRVRRLNRYSKLQQTDTALHTRSTHGERTLNRASSRQLLPLCQSVISIDSTS